ncbi:MAG: YdcF family protein [Acidobacteria bacterium]|nr:YdcF family protein [Acidobacteriota bacterium]
MTVPRGRLQTSRAVRYALVAAIALAAWSAVAWAAASWLVVNDGLPRADALVVLAGSATYPERARRAAELFGEGRAPRVLLTNDAQRSGWDAVAERNPLFVERTFEELRHAGVPASSVEVVPGESAGTFEEAEALREFAASRGLRSLLVVTSGYHSRRALWTLRKVFEGSGVRIGVEAVEPGRQTPRASLWWCSPLGWKLVPGEYVKMIYYRLR